MNEPDEPASRIDYASLLKQALRGVARAALAQAARDGMPDPHHFYVTFRTDAPGVVMSEALRRQYPSEMTVVLQHQFWGLTVEDDAFSVTLRFSGAPTKLVIPFAAMTAFADPGVSFGLRFTDAEGVAQSPAESAAPSVETAAASTEGTPASADNVVAFRPKRE